MSAPPSALAPLPSGERLRSGWVADPGIGRDYPIRLSNSTLAGIAACTTQALLRWYGWTSAEETAAMRAGSAAHAGLAAHFDGADHHQALAHFDAAYQEWAAANVPSDSRLTWRNTRTILSAWLDAHPLVQLPFVVTHTEIPFEVALDHAGEYVLCGTLDAIGEMRETGDIVVPEHKTTGYLTAYWASQFRLSSQVSGYTFAARQHLKGAAVVGAIVNAIEFGRLPSDPTRRCRQHSVPFSECGPLHAKWQMIGPIARTPAQLAMWRSSALKLARDWKVLLLQHPSIDSVLEVAAEGQFTGACRGCAGADWCEQGRDVAMLPQLLQRDPGAGDAP